MSQVVFVVNEKKSYIKSFGWPDVKPNVNLPLVVPLIPGGTIKLMIDEKKHIAQGEGNDLQIVTDQFEKSFSDNITGSLQIFSVKMYELGLNFDPKTGQIVDGGGFTYVVGEPQGGGAGSLMLSYLGPSSFFDGNSPSFDIADGLGCGGSLVLEMGCGNPTNFIIHIEATVGKEDVDDDGEFELICSSGAWEELNLEFDPPKIRIILPKHDPRRAWRPSSIDVIQAIRFPDFLKLVRNLPYTHKETPRIDYIELVNAPNLWLMLFDSTGGVHGGTLSNEQTKMIKMPSVDIENLLIGIVRNLGVGMNRIKPIPDEKQPL